MVSLILFIIGLALTVLSHPKFLKPIMKRILGEGLLTPRKVKPESAEVIRFAGPNMSLFAIGIIFMIIALLIRNF